MTLLMPSVAALLAAAMIALALGAGDLASDRARAQTAADAAALAAVAEAGPYGTGRPADQARLVAEMNGARLIRCACSSGDVVATVTVQFETASAQARAVLDPALLRPTPTAFHGEGLHPTLAAAVRLLLRHSSGAVQVHSGYRSTYEQTVLWTEAIRRYGSAEAADDWVARPGTSKHEAGLAVDLTGDLNLAARLIDELDLPMYRPLEHEPWHFELTVLRRGSR